MTLLSSSQSIARLLPRTSQFVSSLLFACLLLMPLAMPAQSAISADREAEMEQLATVAMDATNQFDFVTALSAWDRMQELEPNNPAVLSNRANALVGLGRLEEAISNYNRVIDLVPQFGDTYINRGAAYEGLGQWDKAILRLQSRSGTRAKSG